MMGFFEFHAMEIARHWHRDPDWFYEQTPEVQSRLWSWYRKHHSGEAFRDPKHARETSVDLHAPPKK